jgi:hypothetical protein
VIIEEQEPGGVKTVVRGGSRFANMAGWEVDIDKPNICRREANSPEVYIR